MLTLDTLNVMLAVSEEGLIEEMIIALLASPQLAVFFEKFPRLKAAITDDVPRWREALRSRLKDARVPPELTEEVRDFRFCRRNAPDAPCLQPFHKGMHEEVLRRKYIDRTCTAGIDVARHGDVVPVHQPVARHTETSGRTL